MGGCLLTIQAFGGAAMLSFKPKAIAVLFVFSRFSPFPDGLLREDQPAFDSIAKDIQAESRHWNTPMKSGKTL